MTTNAKLNVELNLRQLNTDELDIVSGAQTAPSQVMTEATGWKGPFALDLKTVIWETQFRGPKHLAMAAGT